MKNKLIKAILVLFLCIVMLTGCSVVPSSTPDITPTPIEPTPSPYDVIDITVGFYDGSYISRNLIMDALLETVSLKATFVNMSEVSDKTGIDMFIPRLTIATDADSRDHTNDYVNYYNRMGKQYGCIDWRDYLDSMPNYLSRLRDKDDFYVHFYSRSAGGYYYSYENSSDGKIYVLPQVLDQAGTIHPVWIYNEAWFNKYNYDIPENMEELVDLLIAHKQAYPDSTPILSPQVIGYNNSAYTGIYPTLEKGIATAYGVDLSLCRDYVAEVDITPSIYRLTEILKYENGKMELNFLNESYIAALDMIKKVQDNALADAPSYSNVTQAVANTDDFAVTYFFDYSPYIERYYPEGFMLEDNWRVFENQLTMTDFVNVDAVSGYNGYIAHSPIAFLVKDQSGALGEEIERRLVEFIDWCVSDEGILTLTYGIEGDHYVLDENGRIDEIKRKLTATFDVTSSPGKFDKHVVSEVEQYLKEPSEEYKTLVKIENALEGKSINLMINPNINILWESYNIDKELEEMTAKILEKQIAFYKDYMSGAKTADDYAAYVAELEGLGLNDFLTKIEGIYEGIYESGKFVPEALK